MGAGVGVVFTRSGTGQDCFLFVFFAMVRDWDGICSVGVGWEGSENPLACHPLRWAGNFCPNASGTSAYARRSPAALISPYRLLSSGSSANTTCRALPTILLCTSTDQISDGHFRALAKRWNVVKNSIKRHLGCPLWPLFQSRVLLHPNRASCPWRLSSGPLLW